MKAQQESFLTIPNQLTLLRILLVPVFVFLLLQDGAMMKLIGVVVFTVASLTDLYDGWHARRFNVVTRIGAFLDPLADKLLITAAFLVYVWMGYLELWMVLLVVVRDVVVTALRSWAEHRDHPVVTSRQAKYKTFLQNLFAYLVMVLIFLREAAPFGTASAEAIGRFLVSPVLDWIMLLVTAVTVSTGISYLIDNRAFIAGKRG
ncbi:CDP-diacylglycerol--glycerol-3-phosphate 3-phosphatidyltransferase [Chlorobium sp. N1]|uniref:CDP-diacylglycerol--glycerol-3-phosphate 3-phosphatidyltransferase n=1 Tax=Chlorobium sp. N1 TaxID=2491138 RepID=UPI0010408E73|nr:CDP-diacylglycerol--glycerol-3-phosphate 3-phosphatidyltransferase [Chlorobium sp. N1]TCD47620.1 CDP-diacylglycerol--glycerol-3-phosphate 3-phosphatidyltransferase [Chlorobium sp. N1]